MASDGAAKSKKNLDVTPDFKQAICDDLTPDCFGLNPDVQKRDSF
jgi:hypothetical protein